MDPKYSPCFVCRIIFQLFRFTMFFLMLIVIFTILSSKIPDKDSIGRMVYDFVTMVKTTKQTVENHWTNNLL